MRYTTTVLTEFDQELFDLCYANSDADMHTKFTQNIIKKHNALDYTTRKLAIENVWKNRLSRTGYITLKITDQQTDNIVGYVLGEGFTNHKIFTVLHWLVNQAEPTNTEWITDFWEENNYSSQNPKSFTFNNRVIVSGTTLVFQSSTVVSLSPFIVSLKELYDIDINEFIEIFVPNQVSLETIYIEQDE